MKMKFNIIFLVTFLSFYSLQASEVQSMDIEEESYFIKIGTFSKMENVEKIKKRLYDHQLYIEPYKNLHRVYVVNIHKKSLQTTLSSIRKIYAEAYVEKKPHLQRNQIQETRIIKTKPEIETEAEVVSKTVIEAESAPLTEEPASVEDISHLFDAAKEKSEKIESDLDSQSIIKTRKSFL